MLKDPNTKGKRRKKRASLTSLIEKSSVEEIKNKLKLRRKANSVCFNNNNEKQYTLSQAQSNNNRQSNIL